MRISGLSEQMETLVDHLRKREATPPSLTEVAAVTEVLIRTMDGFFRSVDLKIYQECQSLSDYISNARKEIAALEPEDQESARIPRAGKELDAIVRATEEATNTIMTAAEEIMGADPSETEAYQETVNDAVMRIFEACSFQDITGQRISKVVETLTYIEGRAKELRNLMGVHDSDAEAEAEEDISEDKKLLNGPALEGEGIDQSAVDALLNGGEATPAPAPKAKPKAKAKASKAPAKPKEAPAAKPEAATASRPAAAPAPAPAPAPEAKAEEIDPPATGGESTQDDIDALFG